MPQLSDLVQKRKFVKKEYRPWDLSGSGTVDGKEIENNFPNSEIPHQTLVQEKIDVTEKPLIIENISINQSDILTITPPKAIKLTDNKSGNDLDNKKITNKQQKVNNKITTDNNIGNIEVSTREQPENKIGNHIGNTDDLAYLIESIKKLTGIQKNIFYYVISLCSARGALDTGNILSTDLAMASNCSTGSVKTSLIRLIEKKIILRLQGKPSRGGHMVLGITKDIQSAAIQAQQALFNPFKMPTTDNITGNNISNTSSYSSNSKNIIITTSLPNEWKKINFESLEHIGFSETQLRQLFDSKMTEPEIVQDSINKFAFGLQKNEKIKNYADPLNILMGVLRKGNRWNEANYISPKEMALRELLEEKRKRKEERETMIKELIEIEFPEWKRKLTEEEIKIIVPEDVRKTNIGAAIQASLRMYFTEKVLLTRLELSE